jgi:hypothetical protein
MLDSCSPTGRRSGQKAVSLDLLEHAVCPVRGDLAAAGPLDVGRREARSNLTSAWGVLHPRDAILSFGEYTERYPACKATGMSV